MPPPACIVAAQQHGGGAIAKERHADEVGRCLRPLRKDQAAELHRDDECSIRRARRQHVTRSDERAGAARAAKSEQRRTSHVGAQTQAAGEQGVEAGRREPRGRHDVDVIDLVGRCAGLCEAGAHGFLRQLECLGGVFFVSLLERARLQIPLGFVNEMPRVDTSSVEYRHQPLEMGLAFAEPRHLAARERLIEAMRRDRRGHSEDFRHGSRAARVYASMVAARTAQERRPRPNMRASFWTDASVRLNCSRA